MAPPFLVGLRVEDRACVVLGGDDEAADKSARLLDAGARLTVVAPALVPRLRDLVDGVHLAYRARAPRADDIDGAFLAVSTARDPDLSAQLYARASAGGVLLCCLDQPA